jgi:hypothetical protein
MTRFCLTVGLCCCLATIASAAEPAPADAEFFEQHIRPLLENRCFKCHSADAKNVESGLQLDSRPDWQRGGDSGPAIVPGNPDESLLIRALSYSDDEPIQMPPEGKLPDREIALLTEWVQRGAPDPRDEPVKNTKRREVNLVEEGKHWSYQPLTNRAPPEVKNGAWCRTPIDRFILSKLESSGIAPNNIADRGKLIRRAYFSIVGLPPSPEAVETFVKNEAPDAYEQLVNQLLANPHFGERWARHWLDIARFAESHGFEQDYDRPNAYHYRDFVIKAFNEDLPYDTFVKWQLAGDEYAPENVMAMQATGFLAAGVHATQITANQAEKERYDELDDMTRTVGTTMLGLTVGCARCHDHKYDPIPNEDYFGIAAAFTTMVRSDYPIDIDPDGYRTQLAAHEAAGAPLKEALSRFERDELPARFDKWRSSQPAESGAANWVILDPAEFKSQGGATLKKVGDGSLLATGTNPDFDVYTIAVATDLRNITGVRIEALADPSMVKGGPGRASNGNIDLTNVKLIARPAVGNGAPVEVKLANPTATFEQGAHLAAALTIDDKRNSGWAVDPQFGKDHAIAFETTEGIGFPGGTMLEFTLEFNGNNRHNIGRPRLSITTAPMPVKVEHASLPSPVRAALATLGSNSINTRPKAERKTVLDWFKQRDAEWQELNRRLVKHQQAAPKPKLVKMLISSEGVPAVRLHTQGPDFYNKTFIVKRGDPNQKVKEATQRFLTVLMRHPDGPAHWIAPPPTGARTSFRRTALASWMTDTECGAGHLLARVIVNRLWQHHMGRGIVATPSDFGTQGAAPTHPELLDWLAGELIRGGWRLKPIHRLILTSSVFMQDSASTTTQLEADHENLLWWRRPGGRLQAEIIRDAMLAVSGQLDERMFGPGTLDPDMQRRSIYFFIKRSRLVPMMTLFDAPDTLQDLALRSNTTVAPQALLMMNSPIVRGYAEGLAKRATAAGSDVQAQLAAAYRIALCRDPSQQELVDAEAFVAGASLADFCQILLSSNEFVYVN